MEIEVWRRFLGHMTGLVPAREANTSSPYVRARYPREIYEGFARRRTSIAGRSASLHF